MNLGNLLDLAERHGLSRDTPVVIQAKPGEDQNWSGTVDAHLATSEGEPDLLVVYLDGE